MKFFRVREDTGVIAGISEMAYELALANLKEGEELVPYDPEVSPKVHRWSPEGWTVDPIEDPRLTDYSFLRRTGYPSAGDQLGAVMKLLADPSDPAARAEFDAILDTIAAVKAAHPKPGA